MKAVAVAGGSPDTPKSAETEGSELPGTQSTLPEADGSNTPERPEPETAAEPAAGEEPEAEPEPDAASEADGTRESAPEKDTPAEAAAAADTDTGLDGATEEAEAEADVAAEGGSDEGSPAEPAAKTEAGHAPEALESESETESETGSETESEAETGSESESETGSGTESETGSGTETQPGSETGSESGTETETEAETGSEADATATATGAGARPGTEAPGGAATESDAAAPGGDAAEPETAAARGDVPAPGAEPTGTDAPAHDAGGVGGKVSDPRAAVTDGEPAESTATAGGAAAPERETEAPEQGAPTPEPDADAADESPAGGPDDGTGPEDRPVPSWARDDEADGERTSQFVALKDLDAPAQKAPWPRAVPQKRTPGPASAPAPERTPTATPRRTPAPAAPPAAPPAPAPAARAGAAVPPAVVEPTREVPLPPRPPLDLLAELTNNPPPPETPRRTAVRRVKIWTPILLLLAGAAIGGQLLRPLPAPRLVAAEQTHSLDGQFSVPWPAKGQGAVRVPGSGDIGAFGEQKPVPTASVAKVMTAYVILKNHPLRKAEAGPQIEVDAKTVADGTSEHESRIVGLVAGTKFSQQDMLKMLMIPSGNNVARLLARWDTGTDSEAAFVEKMNAAARELGMQNTTYTDPSGLDSATVSTAADQLKLAEAVMKDEAFRAVVALPSAEIKGLSEPLINNNTLLSVNGLSVRGIKTGSSTPAGGTLMWAAYKSVGDETPLILGTLMDQHADGPDHNGENSLKLVLANSKKIIESVRQALDSAPVVRKGQTVGHVDDGLGGRTPLVATKDLNVIGVPGQQLRLTLNPGASGTPHAAKAGTELGVLTAGSGEGAKSVPVALGTSLAEPSFTTRVTRLR
ncbi:serine hydrolase [Streptomyces roseus]|uniref:serine hydrolase n=1 Tax=Streptomyces roseus TaxID=66430 RepID=UPI00368342CE